MSHETRTATGPGAGTAGATQQDAYWLGGWAGGKPLPVNPDSARAFLRWLDPTNDQHAFRLFHETDRTRPAVKLYGTLDQHLQQLERMNAQGYGVFCLVNETDGQDQKRGNVTRVRSVFTDQDGAPLPDPDQHELHAIIWTSAPRDGQEARAHCYLRADIPLEAFRLVQLGLADAFGGDTSVHDLPRVMRLPGFLHQKRADAIYRVTPWWLNHGAQPLTLPELQAMFPAVRARFAENERSERERARARQQASQRPALEASDFLTAFRAWYAREAGRISPAGQGRHELLTRAARHLLDNRLSERHAEDELCGLLHMLPPRPDGTTPDADEARQMVRWVYQNVPAGDPWRILKGGDDPRDSWRTDATPWKPERNPFRDTAPWKPDRAPWETP